jgi:hypothetical protein
VACYDNPVGEHVPHQTASSIMLGVLLLFLGACSNTTPPAAEEQPAPGDLISVLAAHKLVDEYNVNGIRDLDVGRSVFAQPRSKFALPIVDGSRSLDFGFGIVDTAIIAPPLTEGVQFKVLSVDGAGNEAFLWTRNLAPVTVTTDRGLQKANVAIPSKAKQLMFETAPLGDFRNAWSYWTKLTVN